MKLDVFGKQVLIQQKDISDTGYDGFFDPNDYSIVIDSWCDNKFQTFLHEILHAVWFRQGFTQAGIPHEIQELLVENIATMIDENFDNIKKFHAKHKRK